MLDELDLRILRVIQREPDLPVAGIAEQVGLSHTPCWRRLRKLEEAGIVQGRVVLLDARALGLTVNVFAHVRLKQHDEDTLNAFEQRAHDQAEIVECFSMGGESDYVLRVIIRSIEDYERFLKQVLLHMPGVASVNSSFVLKTVKLTTALPI